MRVWLERGVAVATYPGMIVASLLLARALDARRVPVTVNVTVTFLAVLVAVALLERAYPHVPRWRPTPAEARQDLAYLGLAAVLQLGGRLLGLAAAAIVGLALVTAAGTTHVPTADLPLAVRVFGALIVADLGKYTLHRLAHEHPAWWRFHAEHHAPRAMHVWNATRLHPVNLWWNVGLDAFGPALFGLDPRTALLLAVFRGTVAVLQHANVRLALGPLDWIFSTPRLHQWHHSAKLAEANANYGSTFIVWDVLFGTRLLPEERSAPDALGLADGAPHPAALVHQLVWPWCGRRAATCKTVRGWSPLT